MDVDLLKDITGCKMLYTGRTVNQRPEFIGAKAFHLLFRSNVTVHTDDAILEQLLTRIIKIIHQHMHHSFFHGFIRALTHQTINLSIVIVEVCFQNMDSKETGRTRNHDISKFFLGDPVCILFHISADDALDPVIVVIRKLIIALRAFCGCLIIHDFCQFANGRMFKHIGIYNRNIPGKTHHGNLRCGK